MITFECKSCGAPVSADEHQTTAVCKYCNLLQTFDLNHKLNQKLMSHANRLRRAMEYDRAINMYDQILKDDPENPEVHWGKMLSRFGVAYVADAKTGRQIPTCNRMSGTSVFLDPDYQECIENASMEAQMIYEDEARAIEKIRNTYYQIAQKEEPYDVFISYKDSVDNVRTRDSSMAEEIYQFLTEAGYRVFYSRITLANVLGEDYEPYIYAALQSARVMLVLGTKPEHINAEWVKNEWSRYLKLVLAEPEKRALIPLLREMKPSELPEELGGFEGYDMANWRFRDSLLTQIQRICDKKTELLKEKAESMRREEYRVHMISAENLFIRAALELEEGKPERADLFAERGLDLNPQSSEGYWLKLRIHTDDFQNLKLGDSRAEQLYDRAVRTAPEQKKREYEIRWNAVWAVVQWKEFEQQRMESVTSEEQAKQVAGLAEKAIILDPGRKEYKEGLEAYKRYAEGSLLKQSIQNTYGGKDNTLAVKAEAIEQSIADLFRESGKEKQPVSFFPYLFPAFTICIALVVLATYPSGEFTGTVSKALGASVLLSLVAAGCICTASAQKLLFIGIGILLGACNLFTGGEVVHYVLLYAALFVILLLIILSGLVRGTDGKSPKATINRKQKELKKLLKQWDEEYTKALAEAERKYPEITFERDYASCQSPYAEEIFGDFSGQKKRSGNAAGVIVTGICMAVILVTMFIGSAFLTGIVRKNPEVKLNNVKAYVTEIPVREILNDWADQVKQEVAR